MFRGKFAHSALAGIISLLVVLSGLAAHATEPPAVFVIAAGHHGQQQQQHASREHAAGIGLGFQQQQQQLQHPSLHKRRLLRHRSSSGMAGGASRILQQSAHQYTPPKFFISNVKAKVVNTYRWDISRESSATAMSLVASGQERKQMGFTLTYKKVLEKREYIIEGSADVTNLSGQDKLTLLSLTVFVGTTQTQPVCRTMPQSKYIMRPVEELQCPFRLVLTEDPGAANLAGFVQTSRSRVASEPVPFSFSACAGGFSSTPGAAACSVEDVAGCVHVTDSSYIQNRYDDKSGTLAAGDVPRSQLFAVPEVVGSMQGPPATLPTLPDAATSAAPSRQANTADLPDSTWWTKRRLLSLLTFSRDSGAAAQPAAPPSSAQQQRILLQLPPSRLNPLGNQFKWPIPQVTGERPPIGDNGKPLGAVLPMQICSTRVFHFSMIFGPLLPESCGIYEVQNTAAAAYTDSSAQSVVHKTYFYLTVHCPGPSQDTLPTAGFRSLSPDSATGSSSPATPQPPPGPAQLSFASFQRTEAAMARARAHSHTVKSNFAVDKFPLLSSTYSRVVLQAGPPSGDTEQAGQNGTQVGGSDGDNGYDDTDIPYEESVSSPTPASSPTPTSGSAGGTSDAAVAPGSSPPPAASTPSSNATGSTPEPSAPAGADTTVPTPPDSTGSTGGTPPGSAGSTPPGSTGSTPPGAVPPAFAPEVIPTVPIAAGGNISSSPLPATPTTNATTADLIAPVVASGPVAGADEPVGPSNLRVSFLEAKPTLLTSYSWSLSSDPVVDSNSFGNVTYVGCRLKAERAEGMTAQLLVGVVRIGNPSKITDAGARIIRVKSVSVTAMVASNTEEALQPMTVAADCKGSDQTGMLQLMPWRRTNCSFEFRLSVSKEARTLKALAGSIEATAVVELSRASGATEEVNSGPQAFSFVPVLPPPPPPQALNITNGTNTTNITAPASLPLVPLNSSTEAGIQNIAVGSCANFSAGILVAQELPRNASAEAAAVAELGANGTTPDGRGGKCLTVCGVTQPDWEVSIMAPIAGYTQEQCGKIQVYCVGGIIPDNGDWTGSGRLSPAIATISSEVTISGQCLIPSSSSSSSSSGPGGSGSSSPGMLQSTDQTANATAPVPGDDYDPEDAGNKDDYNPQDYGVAAGSASPAPGIPVPANGTSPTPNPTAPGAGGTNPPEDDYNPEDAGDDKPQPDQGQPDSGAGPDSGSLPSGGQGTSGGSGSINTTSSGSSAPPVPVFRVKPPILLSLEGVQLQQIQQFNWTTNLTLGSSPVAGAAAAAASSVSGAVQLSNGAASALTLIARYTKRELPPTGKITGTVKVELNQSAVTPNTINVKSVKALGVYFLTPCGGIAVANITGCNATELTLPATCSFEISNISLVTRPAGIVMANVSVPLDDGTAAAAVNATPDIVNAAVNGTADAMGNGTALNSTISNTTSMEAAADITGAGVNAVASNGSISTTTGAVSITLQSAPFVAVLTESEEVEIDRCVNVTSSFSLTAAGVTPRTPGSLTDAASLPQPVLVPTMQLPDQICSTSELHYELKLGPVSGTAAAGAPTTAFASYQPQSARQAQYKCKQLQLTGASTLSSSHGGNSASSSVVNAASKTWPVHLQGC